MIKPILNIRYSLECDNDVFDFYLLFLKEMEEGKCTLFYLYLCVCVCCVVIHPYIFFHSAVSGLGSNHFTQKPCVNALSYTAESNSCLYLINSSSRPKSAATIAVGRLIIVAGSSDTLLQDVSDESADGAGEERALFMRSIMTLGLTRRIRGERRAKPDVKGSSEAIMATTTKVIEVNRWNFILWFA